MTRPDITCLFQGDRPLFIDQLTIPEGLSLVVLAPHPDDFDAIGVTLRFFLERGCRIDLGVATSGASGVEDSFCGSCDPAVKAALREEEQRASCRFFGLPESRLVFLRLLEDGAGHPLENPENIERLIEFLKARPPELVFLPHGNDTNTGHRRIYGMFRRAVQESGLSLASCLGQDPKTISMRRDLYTVFGEAEAEWKAELLHFHRSQHQRNLNTRGYGFDERILQVNRQAARELGSGAAYAEVFELEF